MSYSKNKSVKNNECTFVAKYDGKFGSNPLAASRADYLKASLLKAVGQISSDAFAVHEGRAKVNIFQRFRKFRQLMAIGKLSNSFFIKTDNSRISLQEVTGIGICHL